jgi:hypothetical protein
VRSSLTAGVVVFVAEALIGCTGGAGDIHGSGGASAGASGGGGRTTSVAGRAGNEGGGPAGEGGRGGAGGSAGAPPAGGRPGGASGGGGVVAGGGGSAAGGTGGVASTGGEGGAPAGGAGGAPVPPGGVPLFVAAGMAERRLSSTDGVHWGHEVAGQQIADSGITAVVFGAGVVVAMGEGGVYTSRDGVTWTTPAIPPPSSGGNYHVPAGAFGDGEFVFVTRGDTFRSPDGFAWTKTSDADGAAGHWQGMAFGNHRFVAIGDGIVKVAEAGKPWHDVQHAEHAVIAFGGGVFATDGGVSSDGVTWKSANTPRFGDLSLMYANDQFYAFGQGGMATSADGVTWTSHNLNVRGGRVAYGQGLFVAAGYPAFIVYSKTGGNWTEVDGVSNANALITVAFGYVTPK